MKTNIRVLGYATEANTITGLIRGYVCIWGSLTHRDSYGTFFDRAAPPDMALDFLPRPIMYEHSADGFVRKEIVGAVTRVYFDDVGVAFEGHLYRSSPFFQKMVTEVLRGELKTSSSTAEHTADFDEDGRFRTWVLHELSLTKYPSEELMPAVEIVRSILALGGFNLPDGTGSREGRDALSPRASGLTVRMTTRSTSTMRTLQELLAAMAAGEEVALEELMAALASEYGLDAVEAAMTQASQEPASEEAPPTELSDVAVDDAVATEIQTIITELEAIAGTVETAPEVDPTALSDIQTRMKALASKTKKPSTKVEPKRGSTQAELVQRMLQTLATTRSKEQRSKQGEAPAGGHNPVPVRTKPTEQTQVTVSDQFQHLNAADMALGYMLLDSASKVPKNMRSEYPVVSEEYMKALSYKTALAIKAGDPVATNYAVRSRFPFKNPEEVFQSDVKRANEVMSGASGQGGEWIHELQGTTLWEYIRQETPLYQRMLSMGMDEQELPQGFNSESIPLEGSDPTWYVAGGAANVDANSGAATPTYASSKFGTSEQSVTVAKLSTAMFFQRELEEDSIINIVQEANRKIRISALEQMEYILLNGDTAAGANTNINIIDGTPAAAPSKPSYMLLNGLLKLPLVTNTANAYNISTEFADTDFLSMLALLPGKYRQDRTKLLFILDSDTALAAANIPTFKTRDTYNPATLEEGTLMKVWKIDIIESGQMPLANASGFVSATPGNNIYGRIALVRPDQWASRWKRRIQTDVFYDSYADSTRITAHMRWGLAYRDSEAAVVGYGVPLSLVEA